MKVAINRANNEFTLTEKAIRRCVELGMTITKRRPNGSVEDVNAHFIDNSGTIYARTAGNLSIWAGRDNKFRSDLRLIQVIEELGISASGWPSRVQIVEIPFSTLEKWYIDEYAGMESIHETHRIWPIDEAFVDCSEEPGVEGVDIPSSEFVSSLRLVEQ